VAVLDAQTGAEEKRLSAGRGASYLTLSPDGSRLFGTHIFPNPSPHRSAPESEITVIDTARAVVVDRIPLHAIAGVFHLALSGGRVLRPSDGKIPSSVAFVQCAGSRDESIGVPYCSRVCCMYAIKQAMLLSGSLPLADITVYYMNIRAFGKGYEQFFQNAKAMGISFVRGKVARIHPMDSGDLSLHVESTEDAVNPLQEHRHDLVVLAQGMIPDWNPSASTLVACASDGFVATPMLAAPTRTTAPGVFVAGTAAGPKDIVDTIAEAGAAAMEVSQYLYQKRAAVLAK
jgi:heterodisulfide reductase subunit A